MFIKPTRTDSAGRVSSRRLSGSRGSNVTTKASPRSQPNFFDNLRQDEEVFKLISDCLPTTEVEQVYSEHTPVKESQALK